MNLAIRGIDGQIANSVTFHIDRHPDLMTHFILANPPFNFSDWGGECLAGDQPRQYGAPPKGNANFAWVGTSSITSRPHDGLRILKSWRV